MYSIADPNFFIALCSVLCSDSKEKENVLPPEFCPFPPFPPDSTVESLGFDSSIVLSICLSNLFLVSFFPKTRM